MRGLTGRIAFFLALLALAGVSSLGRAQAPKAERVMPREQPIGTTGPGSVAWSTEAAPSTPPQPPYPPIPPNALEGPTIPYSDPRLPEQPPRPTIGYPGELAPIPGSLEDQVAKDYHARKGFRFCTWNEATITAFPSTLLWAPPLANKREPRFQIAYSSLDNYAKTWSLDTSIGNTGSFFRLEPVGTDAKFQLDMFAVVISRLSPEDLLAIDYRFGVPLTAKWGDWHAKLSYEHTSAHLGDERILRFQSLFNPPQATFIPSFAKDEVVFGLGRWFWDSLRLYGQVSYAFLQAVPVPAKSKYRYDAGFEWYAPCPAGWSGQPFVAGNVDTRGDQNYQANYAIQAGWMWRNPYQRLTNARLYAEYYDGGSPYNQFYQTREKFYSLGFSLDY